MKIILTKLEVVVYSQTFCCYRQRCCSDVARKFNNFLHNKIARCNSDVAGLQRRSSTAATSLQLRCAVAALQHLRNCARKATSLPTTTLNLVRIIFIMSCCRYSITYYPPTPCSVLWQNRFSMEPLSSLWKNRFFWDPLREEARKTIFIFYCVVEPGCDGRKARASSSSLFSANDGLLK